MYRTANLESCILYIYSTNIGTEHFKYAVYSPFFPLQNAVCFIILSYLVPVLFAFYIQGVLKLKKYFRVQKVKRPESDNDHRLQTAAEVKDEWIYSSVHQIVFVSFTYITAVTI